MDKELKESRSHFPLRVHNMLTVPGSSGGLFQYILKIGDKDIQKEKKIPMTIGR